MKTLFVLIVLSLMTTIGKSQERAKKYQVSGELAPTHQSLKERPQSPPIKTKKEYESREKGQAPFLVTQISYDKSGNMLKEIDYDFYGSGQQVGSTTNKYKGDQLEESIVKDDDRTTTYNYFYNDQGLKSKEIWKQKNGQGAIIEFTYNDEGKMLEAKYLNLDGKLEYSRIFKYKQEPEVFVEEKWEVYTDGTDDLLQYRTATAFENGVEVKKVWVNDAGNPTRLEEYTYNANGLRTIVVESSSMGRTKEVVSYNQYGEPVEAKTYSILEDKSERLDIHTTTTYNKYGQTIGYSYLKGSADTNATKFEYEYF